MKIEGKGALWIQTLQQFGAKWKALYKVRERESTKLHRRPKKIVAKKNYIAIEDLVKTSDLLEAAHCLASKRSCWFDLAFNSYRRRTSDRFQSKVKAISRKEYPHLLREGAA